MFCHKKGFKWLCDDNKACEEFDPIVTPKQTVFQQITTSPEALAPLLVHIIVCEEDTSIRGWTSNVVQSVFETYEEAFAATVAKLKEVAE
jgi:hypothetical protein